MSNSPQECKHEWKTDVVGDSICDKCFKFKPSQKEAEDIEAQIRKVFEKHGFDWVDDIEDGKYIYISSTHDNGTVLTGPFIEDLIQLLQQRDSQLVEKIVGKLEQLMPEKRAKQLGDNLELFRGKRSCDICGTNPELQRKMIRDLLQQIKGEK